MANLFYGQIDTDGQYVNLSELTGVTFVEDNKYQFQIRNFNGTDGMTFCFSETKPTKGGVHIFTDEPFKYTGKDETLWVKANGAYLNIDE